MKSKEKANKLNHLSKLINMSYNDRDEYLKKLNDQEKSDLVNELAFIGGKIRQSLVKVANEVLIPFVEELNMYYTENKEAFNDLQKGKEKQGKECQEDSQKNQGSSEV